jgi:hypothetical protein
MYLMQFRVSDENTEHASTRRLAAAFDPSSDAALTNPERIIDDCAYSTKSSSGSRSIHKVIR